MDRAERRPAVLDHLLELGWRQLRPALLAPLACGLKGMFLEVHGPCTLPLMGAVKQGWEAVEVREHVAGRDAEKKDS